MFLHRSDLQFSLDCLAFLINEPPEEKIAKQAIWRSSMVHFIKCFGHNQSRSSIKKDVIYKDDENRLKSFEFIKNLRDKHFVHDENNFHQCFPGAILNRKESDHKIAKVICVQTEGDIYSEDNVRLFADLVARALDWVVVEFDKLCDNLSEELEALPYEELDAKEEIRIIKPNFDEVDKKRNF